MTKLLVAFLVALAVSGCGDLPIGPVDHSCPTNPGYSGGSGCGHGHG